MTWKLIVKDGSFFLRMRRQVSAVLGLEAGITFVLVLCLPALLCSAGVAGKPILLLFCAAGWMDGCMHAWVGGWVVSVFWVLSNAHTHLAHCFDSGGFDYHARQLNGYV